AGNGGKDTIRGGDGKDVIFGDDPPLTSPVREIFKWSEAQDFGDQVDADNFALDTGNTVIAFDYEVSGKAVDTRFETDTQDISELDNTVGSTSSLESVLNGDANSATYMWESGRPVENVEFRINDIDGDGRVVVRAFDENGNAVEVILSDAGSGLTLSDSDGVPGNDAAASNDNNYTPDSSPEHSVLVNIPGPVVKWEVLHEQDGNLNTGVNFTDITFDVPLVTGMGAGDHLFGDDGDDVIFGQDGDDTIVGGKGADKLSGGADADTFQAERDDDGDPVPGSAGSFIGDHVDGGSEGDDCDTLDLTGTAPVGGSLKLIKENPDSNGNGFDGRVEYFNASGHKVGEMTFEEIEKFIICFTPGTAIATPRGEVPVESIRAGDTVITRDNGIQEVSWAGARSLTPTELALKPQLRPVRIRAGSLGDNLPERDMVVSPQHRVLMANDKTQLYFGEREVIAAASHLVGLPGVERLGVDEPVTYAHFLCEAHEIVLSNGAWTETFQPGDYTMGAMEEGARDEILALFPELTEDGALASFPTVRRSLKRYEAMLLAVN
ncbi:MAG: Hint domain-containing protein, partial [Pseudomonadota bacterium]